MVYDDECFVKGAAAADDCDGDGDCDYKDSQILQNIKPKNSHLNLTSSPDIKLLYMAKLILKSKRAPSFSFST